MVKLNLGGGYLPLDPTWVNVDLKPQGDNGLVCDLDSFPWPFADASVDEVYSSHTWEHLADPHRAIREVARICKEGAKVTIIVPHPWSQMALCPGHRQVIAPHQFVHWCEDFPQHFFSGSPRRLRLDATTYTPDGVFFPRFKRLHRGWSDADVIELCPGACHEVKAIMTVIQNEAYP